MYVKIVWFLIILILNIYMFLICFGVCMECFFLLNNIKRYLFIEIIYRVFDIIIKNI